MLDLKENMVIVKHKMGNFNRKVGMKVEVR